MNIGIIGSGGREHALCIKLKQSSLIEKIYCFPGNAGTSLIAENIEIDIDNFDKIKKKSIEKNIKLLGKYFNLANLFFTNNIYKYFYENCNSWKWR